MLEDLHKFRNQSIQSHQPRSNIKQSVNAIIDTDSIVSEISTSSSITDSSIRETINAIQSTPTIPATTEQLFEEIQNLFSSQKRTSPNITVPQTENDILLQQNLDNIASFLDPFSILNDTNTINSVEFGRALQSLLGQTTLSDVEIGRNAMIQPRKDISINEQYKIQKEQESPKNKRYSTLFDESLLDLNINDPSPFNQQQEHGTTTPTAISTPLSQQEQFYPTPPLIHPLFVQQNTNTQSPHLFTLHDLDDAVAMYTGRSILTNDTNIDIDDDTVQLPPSKRQRIDIYQYHPLLTSTKRHNIINDTDTTIPEFILKDKDTTIPSRINILQKKFDNVDISSISNYIRSPSIIQCNTTLQFAVQPPMKKLLQLNSNEDDSTTNVIILCSDTPDDIYKYIPPHSYFIQVCNTPNNFQQFIQYTNQSRKSTNSSPLSNYNLTIQDDPSNQLDIQQYTNTITNQNRFSLPQQKTINDTSVSDTTELYGNDTIINEETVNDGTAISPLSQLALQVQSYSLPLWLVYFLQVEKDKEIFFQNLIIPHVNDYQTSAAIHHRQEIQKRIQILRRSQQIHQSINEQWILQYQKTAEALFSPSLTRARTAALDFNALLHVLNAGKTPIVVTQDRPYGPILIRKQQ